MSSRKSQHRTTSHRTAVKRPRVQVRARVHAPAFIKRAALAKPSRWRRTKTYLLRYVGITGSVAIHAMILVLAVTTYTVGKQVINRVQEQVIVPDATIIEGAEVGGVPNPGLGGDPTRKAASDDGPELANSDAWTKKPSKELQAAVMGNAAGGSESAIGVGSHALGGAAIAGGGDRGAAAPFGMPGGGGGIAPKSTFMGVSGNAKKIVYVCDASGSMVDRMILLVGELERSINKLQPIQGFNVLFFNDQNPQVFATGLLSANSKNKEAFKVFLSDVKIKKSSDPRPALRIAFMEKPDLIFFLTDGDFNTEEFGDGPKSNAQVVKEIRWLNREKRVHINTIAFSSADPDSAEARSEYVATLKLVADESGGNFRFVSSRQMR
jgi:hypothetical protein